MNQITDLACAVVLLLAFMALSVAVSAISRLRGDAKYWRDLAVTLAEENHALRAAEL
jgi:hypothetical protein